MDTNFLKNPLTKGECKLVFAFVLFLSAILPMQTFAQITEFTVENAEGIAIHYEVIDQIAKTVQVGNGSSAAINTGTIGAVTIPETVYDENGVRYTVTEIADKVPLLCLPTSPPNPLQFPALPPKTRFTTEQLMQTS